MIHHVDVTGRKQRLIRRPLGKVFSGHLHRKDMRCAARREPGKWSGAMLLFTILLGLARVGHARMRHQQERAPTLDTILSTNDQTLSGTGWSRITSN